MREKQGERVRADERGETWGEQIRGEKNKRRERSIRAVERDCEVREQKR